MGHIGDGAAKCQMMSSCQKDVYCQKNQVTGLWKVHKKYIDIMRFTYIDINFGITYDGNQKPSKCAQKVFLGNFGDLHI